MYFAEHPYNMLQLNRDEMARDDPPTEHQLERIDELINHPAIRAYMDENPGQLAARFAQLIEKRGSTGVLINWLKTKIKTYENTEEVDA